jgi:hypothetical protein
MFPEPHRIDGPRVPLELFVRPSATDPRLFDVVDDAGAFIARDVPDLNTARVLAAAPRLLDGFYEMRWKLCTWFVYGFGGVGHSRKREEFDEPQERYADWLDDMADIEADACAPDGRFPL